MIEHLVPRRLGGTLYRAGDRAQARNYLAQPDRARGELTWYQRTGHTYSVNFIRVNTTTTTTRSGGRVAVDV
jgi:hypothetical protein